MLKWGSNVSAPDQSDHPQGSVKKNNPGIPVLGDVLNPGLKFMEKRNEISLIDERCKPVAPLLFLLVQINQTGMIQVHHKILTDQAKGTGCPPS